MRQLNDRPKSQTAKTSSEQVPYRSLVCKHKSSFAALLLLFPKSLRLFGNPMKAAVEEGYSEIQTAAEPTAKVLNSDAEFE